MGYVGKGSKKSVLRRGLDSLGRINYFSRGPLGSSSEKMGVLRAATTSLAANEVEGVLREVPTVFPVPSVVAQRLPTAEEHSQRQQWKQVGPIRDYTPWWVRVREQANGEFILEETNKEDEISKVDVDWFGAQGTKFDRWVGGVHLSKGMESFVTPGAGLSTFSYVDVRGFDLSEGVFADGKLESVRFDCCNLDKAVIPHGANNVSFDGASLRGADLRNRMSNISMVGADLTDVDFTGIAIWGDFDVTDSNITKEQYEKMREQIRSDGVITYRRYSVDDFLLATGMDKETFLVTAWASELDLRDDNGEPTNNIDEAHIPQWEMQRIAVQGW